MNKRNSNLEVLRIIAMAFIVLSHYVVHSGANLRELPLGFNRILLDFGVLGNIGTTLFVLISGYFLINSKQVELKKIIHLWLQVFFYSIIIYCVVLLVGKETLTIKELIQNLFPISFKIYWFATAYFIIYLFHPFINKYINSLTKQELSKYVIVSIFLFYLMSTITTMDYYGNELIYFVIIYCIGAYFSKYRDEKKLSNSFYKKVAIGSLIAIIISVIFLNVVGLKINIFRSHTVYFLKMHSILVLAFSVSLFLVFAAKEPKTNCFINLISSLLFGIYLISDNKYIRPILWKDILNNEEYFMSKYLIIHMITSVLLVCLVCLVIELIRKKVFDIFVYKWLDKKIEHIEEKLQKKKDFLKLDIKEDTTCFIKKE